MTDERSGAWPRGREALREIEEIAGFGYLAYQDRTARIIALARAALSGAPPPDEQAQIASLRSVLAPLRELAERATPGPWRDGDGEPFHEGGYAIVGASPLADPVAYRERILFRGNAHFEDCADNVRLIVALVNALPALLNALVTEGAAPEATSCACSCNPHCGCACHGGGAPTDTEA